MKLTLLPRGKQRYDVLGPNSSVLAHAGPCYGGFHIIDRKENRVIGTYHTVGEMKKAAVAYYETQELDETVIKHRIASRTAIHD